MKKIANLPCVARSEYRRGNTGLLVGERYECPVCSSTVEFLMAKTFYSPSIEQDITRKVCECGAYLYIADARIYYHSPTEELLSKFC